MNKHDCFVHPHSQVHPQAQLDSGVYIGPDCCIGENVIIHKNTRLDAHVFIGGWTEIGRECHFFPFSSIGTEPQDVTYQGEKTLVKIGDKNVFREFITVHRGTIKGRKATAIGNNNYFMAYSHIAHDCRVGSETVFINGATLGGHVEVQDFATVGAFSGIHQFCRIGKFAYIGGFSVLTQDVVPFCRVAGSRPPLFYGVNALGLRRKGVSKDRIRNIKGMLKIIFHSNLTTRKAVEKIEKEFPQTKDREEFIQFIRVSERGILKKASEE
ncbi:acyl-ACP--UDP-N-acetylglucosamine O-acyltransferase [bacterium]|nr:acyl-ACP--UDP-N-acetylglucosamine O-acyltransferase [bacterium]